MDPEFYEEIGRRIAAFRRERGWTQIILGDKVGVEPSYITRIEAAGRRPTIDTLRKIAEALGVPFWSLFTDRRLTEDEQPWTRTTRELGDIADGLPTRDLRILMKLAERLRHHASKT
jgi:transcriptional regulator with XRE-family HTH domain